MRGKLLSAAGLLLLLLSVIQPSKAQLGHPYFSKILDVGGHRFQDLGLDGFATGQGRYVVFSSCMDTVPGDTNQYLFWHPAVTVFDWVGTEIDTRRYEVSFQSLANVYNNCMVRTIDSGYAIGGNWIHWTSDFIDGYHGQFILKLDLNLQPTWLALDSVSLIVNWTQTVCGMVQTQDGGYVIAGVDHQSRMTFTRYDALGNKLWHRQPSSLGNSLVKSFHALPDGGFFLCGMKAGRAHVSKLDDSCNLVWERNYDADGTPSNIACGVPRKGGGYFFGYGRTDELYPQFADIEYFWLSHNLKVIHSKRLYIPRDQWVQEVIELEDGSIVVSGRTGHNAGGDVGDRTFLLKFSPEGELLWFNKYHWWASGTNINNDVCSTPDGDFLLVGHTWDTTSTSPYSDTWVLKVDSVGCPFPGCTPGTWVEEAQEEAADVVAWPNPASDMVTFRNEGDLYEAGTLTLFSPEGKVLEQVLMPQGFQETSLELTPYPQGTYYWQYTRASGTRSAGKVMVRR